MPSHRFGPSILAALVLSTTALLQCGGDGSSTEGEPDAGDASDARARRDAPVEDVDQPLDGGRSPATEGSGTRFRLAGAELVFTDGTELRATAELFYDSQLHTLCQIQEVAPNQYVCLSTDRVDVFGLPTFADPACTAPVIGIRDDDAKFVRWGAPCAAKIGLVGPLKKNVQTYARDPVTQECRAYEYSVSTMAVPAEMRFSDFGDFTRTADATPFPGEKSGTRLVLKPERFTGSDGSFQARAPRIVDLVRGASGTLTRGADAKSYLFTTAWGDIQDPSVGFADATCTEPTLAFPRDHSICHDDPFRPRDAVKRMPTNDAGCHATRAFERPAGAPLPVLYETSGVTCRANLLASRAVALDRYPAQPLIEIPLSSFVELGTTSVPTNANAISGTMLEARATVTTSADGLELRARTAKLHLLKYQVPCDLARTAGDDTERCVPDGAYAELGAYADAACTQPALRVYGINCGLSVPFVQYYENGGVRVAKLASAPPLTNAYQKDIDGACVASTIPPGELRALADVEILPASDFPAVASRTTFVE